MPYSIVCHFNQTISDNTVSIKSLVVSDIKRIENNIVHNLGVFKDGQTVGYSFLPTKKFKATSQITWFTKHLHGVSWSSGHKNYTELEKDFAKSDSLKHRIFCQRFWKM